MTRISRFFSIFSLVWIAAACLNTEPGPTPLLPTPQLTQVETRWGDVVVNVKYYYRADGQPDSLVWSRKNMFESKGKEVFVYDAGNRLSKKIVSQTGLVDQEIVYTWADGKIAVARSYYNGKKDAYQFYDYNELGQLIKIEYSKVSPESGGFFVSGENHYTYHADGNLHQIKEYVASLDEPQLILAYTKIYTNYLDGLNPLPSMEILPNVVLQKNLPASYVIQYPENTLTYAFTYSMQANGYPSARTVTGVDAEQNTYTYK